MTPVRGSQPKDIMTSGNRLAWSSRSTSLVRLFALLLFLAALTDSAALPSEAAKPWLLDAFSIAASLDADHASFEPISPHESTTNSPSTTKIAHTGRREAATTADKPPNTDPYKWELCCAIEGTWECNMALTGSCRGDSRFRCELDGTLTHKKDSDECSKLCACFEWSEEEGKPPAIRPGHSKKDKASAPAEQARAKAMEAASPFDFVDYTRKVTPG